jgi:hypothetical protein
LRPIIDALTAAGIAVEPVPFAESEIDTARDQMLRQDGLLVWVDPIAREGDRAVLDSLLRDVASAGVWVSTHPDVTEKMGTKEVLFTTRDVGWGGDIHMYRTPAELESEFARRLAAGQPRILKQQRGNAGIGVWKVEAVDQGGTRVDAARVRVQHAAPRDTETEEMPLHAFVDRWRDYLLHGGLLIDQPFQPRIVDGLVRAYMVGAEVAGFAHQFPDEMALSTAPGRVLGLPSAKAMYPPSEELFAGLRDQLQRKWISAMMGATGVDGGSLPLLWDADFLYGTRTAAGVDTYVLCEINVSCVIPVPETVPALLAAAVARRLAG